MKGNNIDMVEFFADWINDTAGVDASDSLKDKIRRRIVLLSDESDIRLDNIVNDFRLSDDTELHKIADRIAPFLNKGKYSHLFVNQEHEIKTLSLDGLRIFQPFNATSSKEPTGSLMNAIYRYNGREYTSLSDDEIAMLDAYDRMSNGFGFYIDLVFSPNNEQKKRELLTLPSNEKIAFCKKENPKIHVCSFVKDK